MSASFVFVVSWKRETEAAAAVGGKISRVTVRRPSWNYFLFRFFFHKVLETFGGGAKSGSGPLATPADFPANLFQTVSNLFQTQTVSNSFLRFQTEKMFTLSLTRPPPSRSLNSVDSVLRTRGTKIPVCPPVRSVCLETPGCALITL